MNTTGRTIAKNASVMMASQVITWGLALVLMIFLPRLLGAEAVGKYQLAVSIWAVVSIGIGFGMDTMLTKEIARNPARCSELLSTSLFLKLGLFLLGFVLVSLYARGVGYPKETIEVINIIGISTLSWQMAGAFGAALQAFEHMEFISISDILGKLLATTVSITALLLGYRVITIAWINVISSLVSLVVMVVGLRRCTRFSLAYQQRLFGWVLKSSYPYLIVTGFLIAYNQIDVIIISLLVNEAQIGWYSAASRLFSTFLFLPTVLIMAVFPVFSRLHVTDPVSLQKLLNRSFDILLLTGIPIGLGLFAIANPLIILLFGPEFANAGPVLAVMGIVIIATYLNALLGKYYVSTDRTKVWTWVMGAAALLTIPLDLVLVPLCQRLAGIGALGGSFSYLVTEFGMVLVGLVFLPKGMLGWRSAWFALRAVTAGLLMAAIAWYLRGYFLAVPILAGGAVYLGAILVFRVISEEDWVMLKEIGRKLIARVRRARPQLAGLGE